MRPGGWIHPHVMDAFGMLILTDMYYRDIEGRNTKNDILKHIVIKDVTVCQISNPSNCFWVYFLFFSFF